MKKVAFRNRKHYRFATPKDAEVAKLVDALL